MKKVVITAFILAAVASIPAHAISHAYRAQLEREHRTQVQDANQIRGHEKDFTNDADVVMNVPIDSAADYLLSKGWKPNNGDWFKSGRVLRLVVQNNIVVNAQVM